MRQFLVVALSALALTACTTNPSGAASPAIAAQAPTEAASVQITAPTAAYGLDLSHTSVQFRIRHLGLAMYTARFNKVDGTLNFNQADPTASTIEVTIDPSSVDTGLQFARANDQGKFNGEIAQALGASPITFKSTKVERTGPAVGRVTGDLTMNGQTRPVTLDVTYYGSRTSPFAPTKTLMGFAARGVIDRTQWGVNNWIQFTDRNVEIVIESEFGQK